jgi:hypothetical protein
MLAGMTRKMLSPLALLLCLAAGMAGGCGSDTVTPAPPAPKLLPVAYKIEVPDGLTTDPALAVPAGISEDGQVVVGTIAALLAGGTFVPITGFKWTLAGGTSLFDDVPGFEGQTTIVYGTNRNGSVIIGYASNLSDEQSASWVWTAAKGYQFIPVPAGTIDSILHDVTADGTMVLGSYVPPHGEGPAVRDLFVWSEKHGFVPLGRGLAGTQVLPVGISDNGLAIAYNCLTVDKEVGECGNDGTWTLQSSTRAWAGPGYTIAAPPIEQTEHQFWASDLSTDEFGYFSTHSSDLTVIGGYANIEIEQEGGLYSHPAVWMGGPGHLNILTGLGWTGRTGSVSPDGTRAGFSSHFGAGTPYAHLWTVENGVEDLYYLMWHADAALGSNLLETFSTGEPQYLTGFSADNERVVGVSFDYDNTDDKFGFLIDNLSRLIP